MSFIRQQLVFPLVRVPCGVLVQAQVLAAPRQNDPAPDRGLEARPFSDDASLARDEHRASASREGASPTGTHRRPLTRARPRVIESGARFAGWAGSGGSPACRSSPNPGPARPHRAIPQTSTKPRRPPDPPADPPRSRRARRPKSRDRLARPTPARTGPGTGARAPARRSGAGTTASPSCPRARRDSTPPEGTRASAMTRTRARPGPLRRALRRSADRLRRPGDRRAAATSSSARSASLTSASTRGSRAAGARTAATAAAAAAAGGGPGRGTGDWEAAAASARTRRARGTPTIARTRFAVGFTSRPRP